LEEKMKKLITFTLAIVLVFIVTACNGGNDLGGGGNLDRENSTLSNLPTIEENPVSDFEYSYNVALGGLEITKY
jgi:predicted small secreted protein